MTPAVAKKVKGEVMTSSPGRTSRAIRAMSRASVPEETPTAKLGAGVGGDRLFEGLDLGAHDEVLGVADFVDDRPDLVADGPVLGFEVEHRDVGDHEGGSFQLKLNDSAAAGMMRINGSPRTQYYATNLGIRS